MKPRGKQALKPPYFQFLVQNRAILPWALLIAVGCPGCIWPPKRDLSTLSALESLSGRCAQFYAGLDKDPLDTAEAEKISQSFASLIMAQELRGKRNSAQISQCKLVLSMFKRQMSERKRDGPWKPEYWDERFENFSEVLNAAVRIEKSRPE